MSTKHSRYTRKLKRKKEKKEVPFWGLDDNSKCLVGEIPQNANFLAKIPKTEIAISSKV